MFDKQELMKHALALQEYCRNEGFSGCRGCPFLNVDTADLGDYCVLGIPDSWELENAKKRIWRAQND